MKKFVVFALMATVGAFNGVEFRSILKDEKYIGRGEVPEEKLEWFKERPDHFEIGDAIEVPDVPAASSAVSNQAAEIATLKGELEEVKTAALSAVGDLQGHLDQIAVLTGAKDGTMDAIAKALKTFKPK